MVPLFRFSRPHTSRDPLRGQHEHWSKLRSAQPHDVERGECRHGFATAHWTPHIAALVRHDIVADDALIVPRNPLHGRFSPWCPTRRRVSLTHAVACAPAVARRSAFFPALSIQPEKSAAVSGVLAASRVDLGSAFAPARLLSYSHHRIRLTAFVGAVQFSIHGRMPRVPSRAPVAFRITRV